MTLNTMATGDGRPNLVPVRDSLKRMFEDLVARYEGRGMNVPTGIKGFDSRFRGIAPGELVLVSSQQDGDATTVALKMALHAAMDPDRPIHVAIISCCMLQHQLTARLLCLHAEIDAAKLRSGNINKEDWTKMTVSSAEIAKLPITTMASANVSVSLIRERLRALPIDLNPVGLVIVDGVQMLQGRGETDAEEDALRKSLKALAMEMQIPFVVTFDMDDFVDFGLHVERKNGEMFMIRVGGRSDVVVGIVPIPFDEPEP